MEMDTSSFGAAQNLLRFLALLFWYYFGVVK
jgi:hypothetical protein